MDLILGGLRQRREVGGRQAGRVDEGEVEHLLGVAELKCLQHLGHLLG